MQLAPEHLRVAMNEKLVAGELEAYVDSEIALEDLLASEADAYAAAGQFGESAARWHEIVALNQQLVGVLDHLTANAEVDTGKYDAQRLRSGAADLVLVATGRGQLALGQQLMMERNPGEAATHLKEAQTTLAGSRNELASTVLAEYAGALTEFATGIEQMLRGDFDSAAAEFMRARAMMDALLEDTLPEHAAGDSAEDSPEVLESFLRADAFAISSQHEKSSFMGRLAAGDYQSAADHAQNLCTLLQNALGALPDEAPRWQRYAVEAQLAWAEADKERATAFLLREREEWDEVQAAYRRATSKLSEAANLTLRTGLPGATATQESLMAMATITIAPEARQARAEQKLKEEIHELRTQHRRLVERVSSAGVTVNNTVDAVAVAEQNTEIAVQVTQTVKNILPELRAALDQLALPEAEELKREAEELEKSDEQPAGFLERARSFTQKVAEIVKNVGDAAQPLVPVVQKLAPLVGLALTVL